MVYTLFRPVCADLLFLLGDTTLLLVFCCFFFYIAGLVGEAALLIFFESACALNCTLHLEVGWEVQMAVMFSLTARGSVSGSIFVNIIYCFLFVLFVFVCFLMDCFLLLHSQHYFY